MTVHYLFICSDTPGVPTSLRSTESGQGTVLLSWAPPVDDGGSPIIDYVVEKRDALRVGWTQVGTSSDTSYRVTRLNEQSEYMFRVRAVNKLGQGAPEELTRPVAARVVKDVPASPSDLRIGSIYQDTISLDWNRPLRDGGAPVQGYVVEQRKSGGDWYRIGRTSDSSYAASGLMEGTSYEFRVAAENREGLSSPSGPTLPIVARDPWTKPSAPAALAIRGKADVLCEQFLLSGVRMICTAMVRHLFLWSTELHYATCR